MKRIEEQFHIEIKGRQIPAKIVRESRRGIRAAIGKEAVTLRMPLQLSAGERAEYVEKFKIWLEKKSEKHPELLLRFELKNYQDGAILSVGNRHYLLKINYLDKNTSSGRLKDGTITLNLSATAHRKTIASLLSRLIGKDFLQEVTQRVLDWNARYFRKEIHSVSLKYLHSRWGSCSSKGNINLSTRLLFAPQAVQDYVIVHELAHLIEMNHSPRFWKVVTDVMPDYKAKQKWLRENGEICRF